MRAVILLATYNGERFLREQLDSVFGQSHTDLLLIAKDDQSTDGSAAILEEYQRRHTNRFRFLGVDSDKRGPSRLFSSLVDYVLTHERELQLDDYCIGFCDQDDVWKADKLRIGVESLQAMRSAAGTDAPLLVHSELAVVDEHGVQVSPRFSAYQGLRPRWNDFVDLIVSNVVTGCTLLMTPALARASMPIPDAAVMHDWWIALVASLDGRIHFIDEPLVAYRQHGANAIGAKKQEAKPLRERLALLVSPETDRSLKSIARQARHLRMQRERTLTLEQKAACSLVHTLRFNSILVRLATFVVINHMRTLVDLRRRIRRRGATRHEIAGRAKTWG